MTTCSYKALTPVNEEAKQQLVYGRPMVSLQQAKAFGARAKLCPYFLTQDLVSNSYHDVVCVPHKTLGQFQRMRQLKLWRCIVILDEGHNIVDEMKDAGEKTVACGIVETAVSNLRRSLHVNDQYQDACKAVVTVCEALLRLGPTVRPLADAFYGDNETVRSAIREVERLLDAERMWMEAKRVWIQRACVERGGDEDAQSYPEISHGFQRVADVLRFLIHVWRLPARDHQRVMCGVTGSPPSVRIYGCYVMDNFARLMRASLGCHVISATLRPFQLMVALLAPHLLQGNAAALVDGNICMIPGTGPLDALLHLFACDDHVASPSRYKLLTVTRLGDLRCIEDCVAGRYAANDRSLTFNYIGLRDGGPIIPAGLALLMVAMYVDKGVIAFMTSFANMDAWKLKWSRTRLRDALPEHEWCTLCRKLTTEYGSHILDATILQAIERVKRGGVHWDARGPNGGDVVGSAYKRGVDTTTSGAVLVTVMRGRLSEGISYDDDYGRGIVVFGMPFRSTQDSRTNAWNRAVEQSVREAAAFVGTWPRQDDMSCGAALCDAMRAINQCAGRGIRHKGDRSVVVAIDSRFGERRNACHFPAWLRRNMSDCARLSLGEELEAFHDRIQASTTQDEPGEGGRVSTQ